MEWLWRMLNKNKQTELYSDKAEILAQEIWGAQKELRIAELKLSEAVHPDQIDYAIYITEAAEKRLNMLIREAREQQQLEAAKSIEKQSVTKNKTIDM